MRSVMPEYSRFSFLGLYRTHKTYRVAFSTGRRTGSDIAASRILVGSGDWLFVTMVRIIFLYSVGNTLSSTLAGSLVQAANPSVARINNNRAHAGAVERVIGFPMIA